MYYKLAHIVHIPISSIKPMCVSYQWTVRKHLLVGPNAKKDPFKLLKPHRNLQKIIITIFSVKIEFMLFCGVDQ